MNQSLFTTILKVYESTFLRQHPAIVFMLLEICKE